MNTQKKRRVLFVDDEIRVLQGLKRMLRPMRNDWDMEFAQSGREALEKMDVQPFDVVVSDMRMPEMNGAELLTQVMKRFPKTVRIVLSGQAEKESMLKAIGPSHQYMSKPCDAQTLKQTVSQACALRDILEGDRLSFVSQMPNLPSLPEIYSELIEELSSSDPSIVLICRLIEKDLGLTAKLLQLVNSAYFGVRRHISSTDMAIKLLGLDNVSSLVLATNVYSQISLKESKKLGLSMDQLWQHSSTVGYLSQKILVAEKADKIVVDSGLTAGLLHDSGKLVLASNICDEYKKIMASALKDGVPLHIAEEEVLGATHAEVGAYLLGLWGLPDKIIEAVAFHHSPGKSMDSGVSALTAVYVADFIENKRAATHGKNTTNSQPDFNYLASIGVEKRFEYWLTLAD